MQNLIANLQSVGTKLAERALGNQQFWYRNQQYPCVPSSETRGQSIDVGGFEAEVQLSLFVRREILPDGVTVDATIITIDSGSINSSTDDNPKKFGVGRVLDRPNTNEVSSQNGFRNRRYRVVNVKLMPDGNNYRLDLADPN